MVQTSLKGVRTLVVEDEFLALLDLEDRLTELGCHVVGAASTLTSGMALAQTLTLDAALVDLDLAGTRSYPICSILLKRGVPLLLSTGFHQEAVDELYADNIRLIKPFDTTDLGAALRRLLTGHKEHL